MSIELRRENWAKFVDDAAPLLAAHRAELDLHAPIPYALNSAMFSAIDRVGALVIIAAREDGALIGYCIWTLGEALDCVATVATQGPWYVRPDRRQDRIGLRLLEESIATLRALHVDRVIPHYWPQPGVDSSRIEALFAKLGATPLEISFSLWLKE